MANKTIELKGVDPALVFGVRDAFINKIEESFGVRLIARGTKINLEGDENVLGQIERVFGEMLLTINRKGFVDEQDVTTLINMELGGQRLSGEITADTVILFKKTGVIKPRSVNQEHYFRATLKNDLVFGIGPAGTGKTYLAVAIAVAALRNHDVQRLILTRPAVEAGESLGFLPGDLTEKIEPYLAPLYDALYDMLPPEKVKVYEEQHIIEVLPLAYMRGRTLNNAYVILDEAQNTTPMQMKMFLTRLGANSKAIVTGDITQIDLPDRQKSGLIDALEILNGIEGIEFVYFDTTDVVRHHLVKKIIKAYNGGSQDKS
ncbi:MAG TPA: PhoH family protein [Candidatus Marinimicrobia bacterium]|nr:PhoH family protein [Candidatus Neomarinimicrobiota bacterium]HRS50894.1 PhoH family protein [Candidatus Neomarinimicrobiota bacterium]HRU91764.1 PhoH family protein [Candidatus Neomarinimicrobiota bacterium]